MTTKTIDSTVSQLLQDNSSVEYVGSHENPIATIPRDNAPVQDVEDPRSLELIFGQRHHEIDCALCPTAKRACNRAWVTAKQIESWSGMTNRTLYNRLSELEEYQRISRLQDFANVNIPTETGAVKTTLYNLNVLNQLAMVEMKNKVLNDTAKEFSDILSEVETTGSYGVAQQELSDAEIMSRALEIAHRTLALREERIKALTAERDEAVRTKAMIGSRREATAMATASAKSRECEKLREQIGDSETYKRATAIPWLSEYFDTRNDGLYNSLAAQLRKIEASMPPEFAHKPTPDTRYGSVKAYHIAVIERFHEIVREKLPVDKKFMEKYRKDVSPKTKNA